MHRKRVTTGGREMRLFVALTLSAAAILLPAAALSEPAPDLSDAQGPGISQAPSTPPGPTTPQGPNAAQAAAAPSGATAVPRQPASESVVVRADAVDLDQVVCKEAPPKTGSRIGGGRECLSQREWNRRTREAQDITRHQQRMSFHGM